jgi:membrane fusion protein (multidrug efflux system)
MNKYFFTLLFSLLFLIGCQSDEESSIASAIDSKDLAKIKEKRAAVQAEMDKIAAQLAKLDAAIGELDTLKKLPLVKLETIKDTIFKHYIEVSGKVDTRENVIITPEYAGVLTQVNVRAGQNVGKGQILGRVDDGGMSAQLAQAEAQYALSKTTFERQKNLWDQKIGSEMQYLQARTAMNSQQKVIEQIKAQINKTYVRAAFSGTIDEVLIERGQVVAPGTPLFRLVSLRDMFVEAKVPEIYMQNLKQGAAVNVNIASIGKIYQGKIRLISKNIDPTNRTLSIEVQVPNIDQLLRPNQIAILQIEDYVNKNAIVISEGMLVEKPSGAVVYTLNDKLSKDKQGVVKEVAVTVGKKQGNHYEILAGLANDDQIISDGAKSLQDQTKVQVVD